MTDDSLPADEQHDGRDEAAPGTAAREAVELRAVLQQATERVTLLEALRGRRQRQRDALLATRREVASLQKAVMQTQGRLAQALRVGDQRVESLELEISLIQSDLPVVEARCSEHSARALALADEVSALTARIKKRNARLGDWSRSLNDDRDSIVRIRRRLDLELGS